MWHEDPSGWFHTQGNWDSSSFTFCFPTQIKEKQASCAKGSGKGETPGAKQPSELRPQVSGPTLLSSGVGGFQGSGRFEVDVGVWGGRLCDCKVVSLRCM